MINILDFIDYKEYLHLKLDELDGAGRGSRARLSKSIGCQTAYMTQVLKGGSHFSLEHGEAINDFLGHSENQGDYFLLLIQYSRAGTHKLKARLKKQIEKHKKDLSLLKTQLAAKESLSETEQPLYYSSWIYAAVHAIVSIPEYQNLENISARLGITVKQVNQVLEFLIATGVLIKGKNNQITTGRKQIHLGSDSSLISRHHSNWRLQAIKYLEKVQDEDLNYSSVVSLSFSDKKKIKSILVDAIKRSKEIIKESKEEDLCCFSLDFFSL